MGAAAALATQSPSLAAPDSGAVGTFGRAVWSYAKSAGTFLYDSTKAVVLPGIAPGGSVALNAAAQGIKAAGEAAKNATAPLKSAAQGAKTGFTIGVFALVLLVGLFVWAQYKSAFKGV